MELKKKLPVEAKEGKRGGEEAKLIFFFFSPSHLTPPHLFTLFSTKFCPHGKDRNRELIIGNQIVKIISYRY